MQSGVSRHHMIAKEVGGTWDRDNLWRLDWVTHNARHRVFHNLLPIEAQIQDLDNQRTVYNPEVYHMIRGVLVKVDGIMEAYNPKCYRPDRLADYLQNKN